MLELKNIVKVYPSGGENIRALKGVSLRFRNNEFVSILGPSGCGKTTTLNIIGGLDHYTDGDLVINGRSTKEYKDRDWDTYRNHSIGFVFQSYNLIPHQTVLSNVELALTLSGIGGRERRERAKKALEAVGLGTQLKKRPAQMSGGQMQRVAIARAIVNDPDIILADEPTGALDSETSIQVMNILKDIAKDRLVIMVTHNPELAMEYSTRIIRMLDGNIVEDSRPIQDDELAALEAEDRAAEAAGSRKAALALASGAAAGAEDGISTPAGANTENSTSAGADTENNTPAGADTEHSVPAGAETIKSTAITPEAGISTATAPETGKSAAKKKKRDRKASMSFLTAFGLSLNNLFTKKGRTLLTSFAGSIGIIGIALIYAVSQGTSDYIDTVQEDTLTSYPLTVSEESVDFSSMISSFMSTTQAAEDNQQENSVVEQQVISSMFSGVGVNDLRSLKHYLDENEAEIADDVTAVTYSYGITPLIYTIDCTGELLQANPGKMASYMGMSGSAYSSYSMSLFSEMMDNYDKLNEQYKLVAGDWPDSYDEMVLVLNSPDKITDMLTYSIGLHDPDELTDMLTAVMNGEVPETNTSEAGQWTYDELLALQFRLVSAGDLYRYDSSHKVWEDMSSDSAWMDQVWDNSLQLKVVGIACPTDSTASLLSVGFNYLPSLTEYIIDRAAKSEIVQMQLADETVDVFSGQPFGEESTETGLDFSQMFSVDENALSNAFSMDFNMEKIGSMVTAYLKSLVSELSADNTQAAADFNAGFIELGTDMLNSLVEANGGKAVITLNNADKTVTDYLAGSAAQNTLQKLASAYGLDASRLEQVYHPLLTAMLTDYVLENSEDLPQGTGIVTETPVDGSGTAAAPEPNSADFDSASAAEKQTEEESSADTKAEGGDDTEDIVDELLNAQAVLTEDDVDRLVSAYAANALTTSVSEAMGTAMLIPNLRKTVESSVTQYTVRLIRTLMGGISVNQEAIANAFQFNMTEEDMTRLITALYGSSSAASASDNLSSLGYADRDEPDTIYVYLKNFEAKDRFKAFLDDYNDQMEAAGEEDKVIRYTDITGVLMSSVTTIIDAVTYVLIAFVAISLIVSSIMIGVITLISVQERTKEIGILRAIGASKRNVSSMFNAETVIIGFSSGMIGVLVTYLLCIPINIILHRLTNISYLSAKLPLPVAAALVAISMLLTLVAGIIPSRSAAKKDPVVALRSE